ncbi:hypothetical protein AC578_6502 [Pseudocercospora eumusae]|uniref:Uncharacterized protein n=1 Tax=Pseudocercospora eumusae TaxID=321146 RepID=A0A139HHZ5_9PEZI|nr:hypothetical protein AC578_6502 [Pseudocercospora eumusae]
MPSLRRKCSSLLTVSLHRHTCRMFHVTSAILAFAFVAGIAADDLILPSYPTCTKTITHMASECCPPVPTATATAYTDCGGCALSSASVPLQCFAPCTTTETAGRTTITKCRASPNPSMSVDVRNDSSGTIVNPGGPSIPCTKTITEFQNPCGGCYSTTFKHSSTVISDCSGCALTTTTTHADVGICLKAKRIVCPNGKAQTVTDQGTKTVTGCAVGETSAS